MADKRRTFDRPMPRLTTAKALTPVDKHMFMLKLVCSFLAISNASSSDQGDSRIQGRGAQQDQNDEDYNAILTAFRGLTISARSACATMTMAALPWLSEAERQVALFRTSSLNVPDLLCKPKADPLYAGYDLFLLEMIGVIDEKTLINGLKKRSSSQAWIPRGVAGLKESKRIFPECIPYLDHLIPLNKQVFLESAHPGIMQQLVATKLFKSGNFVTTVLNQDGSYQGILTVNGVRQATKIFPLPNSAERFDLLVWLREQLGSEDYIGSCPHPMSLKPLYFSSALALTSSFTSETFNIIMDLINQSQDPHATYAKVVGGLGQAEGKAEFLDWVHRIMTWSEMDVLRFYHFMFPERPVSDDAIFARIELCRGMHSSANWEVIRTWLQAQTLAANELLEGDIREIKSYLAAYPLMKLVEAVLDGDIQPNLIREKVDSLLQRVEERSLQNLWEAKYHAFKRLFGREFRPIWLEHPLIQALGQEQIQSGKLINDFSLKLDTLRITLMAAGLIDYRQVVRKLYHTPIIASQICQLFGDAVLQLLPANVSQGYWGGFEDDSIRPIISSLIRMPSNPVIPPSEVEELTRLLLIYLAASRQGRLNYRNKMFIANMKVGERLLLPGHISKHAFAFEIIKRESDLYEVTILNSGAGIENHVRVLGANRWIYYQKFLATWQQLHDAQFLTSDSISFHQIPSHFIRGTKIYVSSMVSQDSVVSQKSGSCSFKSIMYLIKWFLSRPQGVLPKSADANARYDWFKTWLFVDKFEEIAENSHLKQHLISFSNYDRLKASWNLPANCQCTFTPSTGILTPIVRHALLRRHGMARKHASSHPVIASEIQKLISRVKVDDAELNNCLKCYQ